MLRVLQPRLPTHRRAPLRCPKVIEGCVRQHGHPRLSTTAEPAKPSSPAAEEPGWPLKVWVEAAAVENTSTRVGSLYSTPCNLAVQDPEVRTYSTNALACARVHVESLLAVKRSRGMYGSARQQVRLLSQSGWKAFT